MQLKIPVNTRFASEGFGGSKFTPMRSTSGYLGPVQLGQNGGPTPTPAPAPTPAPTPAPDVIVRPTTFVVPPTVPYPPTEPVYVTETGYDDTTKTLITVAAAVGLVALGAVLF